MNVRKGFVHWRIASSMIAPKPAPQAVCMPSPQPSLQIHQNRIWRPIKCRQKALVVVSEAGCALAALQGSGRCPSPRLASPQVLTRVRCTLFWKVTYAILAEGLLDHACLNAGFPQPSAAPATLAARSTSQTCWCQLVRATGLKSWSPFSKASFWRQPMELSERNASLHCVRGTPAASCSLTAVASSRVLVAFRECHGTSVVMDAAIAVSWAGHTFQAAKPFVAALEIQRERAGSTIEISRAGVRAKVFSKACCKLAGLQAVLFCSIDFRHSLFCPRACSVRLPFASLASRSKFLAHPSGLQEE